MCPVSDFLVVLATIEHPFSPLNPAEIAEEHVLVENWPVHLVPIAELALFSLSYPELVDWKFNVAIVATELADFARKPSLERYAFLRLSPRGEAPRVRPSWIPNWIGLL
jgi:hypothetical protein